MKKIVLFALLTALLCLAAGAGSPAFGAEERRDIQNVQLSADGKLTWDPYEGATQYWITFEPQAAARIRLRWLPATITGKTCPIFTAERTNLPRRWDCLHPRTRIGTDARRAGSRWKAQSLIAYTCTPVKA